MTSRKNNKPIRSTRKTRKESFAEIARWASKEKKHRIRGVAVVPLIPVAGLFFDVKYMSKSSVVKRCSDNQITVKVNEVPAEANSQCRDSEAPFAQVRIGSTETESLDMGVNSSAVKLISVPKLGVLGP